MNLLKQVEPLWLHQVSLQATSRGGVHTTKHRSSLGYSVGSNEAPEPSQTLQGTCIHMAAKLPAGERGKA